MSRKGRKEMIRAWQTAGTGGKRAVNAIFTDERRIAWEKGVIVASEAAAEGQWLRQNPPPAEQDEEAVELEPQPVVYDDSHVDSLVRLKMQRALPRTTVDESMLEFRLAVTAAIERNQEAR